jgi:hypothetical protein
MPLVSVRVVATSSTKLRIYSGRGSKKQIEIEAVDMVGSAMRILLISL